MPRPARIPELDLLSVGDAATILGLSPDMVRVLHRQGRLPAFRTPRGVRLFRRSDVEELARERKAALNPQHGSRPIATVQRPRRSGR